VSFVINHGTRGKGQHPKAFIHLRASPRDFFIKGLLTACTNCCFYSERPLFAIPLESASLRPGLLGGSISLWGALCN